VHAHLAVDIHGEWDEHACAAEWRRLTEGRGRFLVDPERELISLDSFASYATKADDVAPMPGRLPLDVLSELRAGIRGRRLVVLWGPAARTSGRPDP